jgi:acyl-CoA synthetase (NDP forming)
VEPELQAEMRPHLPSYGSTGNPVDATAQAVAEGGAEECLRVLGRSERFDLIVPIIPLASSEVFHRIQGGLAEIQAAGQKALVHYSYTTPLAENVERLRALSIPCYTSPGRAARGIAMACRYAEFQAGRDEIAIWSGGETQRHAPPAGPLTEQQARAYLAPAEIPAPPEGLARSAGEAVALFERLGGPVALKVQAAALSHKSDLGGVRLNLRDAGAVREAYESIVKAAREARPDVEIDGVLIQRMAPPGLEMILAARVDPDFGPVVVVGLGGIYVELLRDVALRLAPISAAEARAMLAELRGAALLKGLRGQPPADVEALVATIERFSRFAAALPPEVASVEINPLLVHPPGQGVSMVDAAVELR